MRSVGVRFDLGRRMADATPGFLNSHTVRGIGAHPLSRYVDDCRGNCVRLARRRSSARRTSLWGSRVGPDRASVTWDRIIVMLANAALGVEVCPIEGDWLSIGG